MLGNDVGNAESTLYFGEKNLPKGEWNGRVGLRPAPVGAFGLMKARG
jgi:hypothetical protein